MAMEGR